MNKKSTVHQKGITSTRLREIIDICKESGVQHIKITGKDVELSLFPFAVNLGALTDQSGGSGVDSDDNLGHNDDKTDMDLLLHSAGK
jgi:hypothetical protein